MTIREAPLGILMLDTRFPRLPGDIGNPRTWPFPVLYKVVASASPTAAVEDDARKLLPAFVSAGRELVAAGCNGVVTSCGFLALVQDDLRSALGVPVATSALLQVEMVAATLAPGRRVGILTISAHSLTSAHLRAAGVPEGTPVMGMDRGGAFASAILEDRESFDMDAARDEIVAAAEALVREAGDIGAVVLECTNMAPFAADVADRLGLPVYSMNSLVTWFRAGLIPPSDFP
ncbi:MAG: aspartate/glutamate racemase family protein [Pseudomonadota bacterium]